MIDPYDGCQFNCPYCFQMSDHSWNKDIYVNLNIVELLPERLKSWNKRETIYLGSRCDPYMQLEEKYNLTGQCLRILNELDINTMITTKSDNGLIFRDIEIIKKFKDNITILMGISNVNQIGHGIESRNIKIANELHDNHIPVLAFITPVLPYIMDVDKIITSLHSDIPILIDKLRIQKDSLQAEAMTNYIKNQYPEFTAQYDKIINEGDEEYFTELVLKCSADSRITVLF